ncbi:glycerol transporter [Rhodotorula sphaerocarpa]
MAPSEAHTVAEPAQNGLRMRPQPQASARARWSIVDLTVQIPSARTSGAHTPQQNAPQPRWKTKEFYFYYFVFATIVPQMWYIPHRATNESSKLYWTFAGRLQEGWLFGLPVDVSDPQYYLFRRNLPLLFGLALAHVALSRTYRFISARLSPTSSPQSPNYAPVRARGARAWFSAVFSLVLLAALHGTSLPKIVLILYVNYRIARLGAADGGDGLQGARSRDPGQATSIRWRREWTPYATWVFNVGILFANVLGEGYYYSSLGSSFAFLDNYKGLLPRWQISWNITMLRLVSFNMEWYWASSATLGAPSTAAGDAGSVLPEPPTSPQVKAVGARRTKTIQPSLDPSPQAGNYSFLLYLAYVLYPPLYLAGPIMTYPAFVEQLAPAPASNLAAPPPDVSLSSSKTEQIPPTSETSPRALLAYALRFFACLLTMEVVLHTMYVVALKDAGKGWWNGMTPAEVSLVGFWNLIIVWLKLLLPWRFFRLWALADGTVPPENMIRCMANNYSVLGFWRAWHRSYNLWIVRYLYIPLGGSARPLLATLGVFTFVALWHDLRLRLLVWGWGITLFVVPEMAARSLVPASKYSTRPWYRHVAAIGGVANILLLMTANLVGFVVGVDGGKELWGVMLGNWEGRIFLLSASAILFVGVQVMFEYREEERRKVRKG